MIRRTPSTGSRMSRSKKLEPIRLRNTHDLHTEIDRITTARYLGPGICISWWGKPHTIYLIGWKTPFWRFVYDFAHYTAEQ